MHEHEALARERHVRTLAGSAEQRLARAVTHQRRARRRTERAQRALADASEHLTRILQSVAGPAARARH